MEYKTLKQGTVQNITIKQLPMEYKILETGNRSKHNNQNNYQWNIKYQKQGTVQNITIKTTTNGI